MEKVLRKMVSHDAAGGLLLIFSAIVALVLANSPFQNVYDMLRDNLVVLAFADFKISKPFLLWVNDGLMALFFLLIGLEVKRELLEGHLSSYSKIVLPGAAAVAGIVVPALIYVAININDPESIRGWAIPSATDIAFALGIFSLFGRHLSIHLKLFLLTVAIFDDIGAIVIIALFYSQELSTGSLAIAGLGLLGLFALNRFRVTSTAAYLLVGIVVWAAVLKSGVHATLAGFVVAFFIPLSVKNEHNQSLLASLEHGLQPWVAFFILPLFAFANAGVNFAGLSADIVNPLTLGITVGLFIGKQLGIFTACWICIRAGWASLPQGSTWMQLYGVSLLAGIGFTMSLFIGSLAFVGSNAETMASVKIGVLAGSLISAVAGAIILNKSGVKKNKKLFNNTDHNLGTHSESARLTS